MNLTQTANKDLAAGISVDRSLITADFQRHALSEMLGQTILRSSMPTDVLAKYLEKWLINDSRTAEHLFDGINAAPTLPKIKKELPNTANNIPFSAETRFFMIIKVNAMLYCR